MADEYDADNVFAKIIDGKLPAFKVFESKSALAFLDAFPMVEGHTLFVPKAKGYKSFLDMPPGKAADYLKDLQKVAKAVKEATGCDAVNIWQNNGEASGQVVFHPHFHIVPRMKGDNLYTAPKSGAKLEADKATPIVESLKKALNPPPPLKKAKFGKVKTIKPDHTGLNLRVEVLEAATEVEVKPGVNFYEVLCGDATGSLVLSLKEPQKESIAVGTVIEIRNGHCKMVKGHVRVVADKWGKIVKSEDQEKIEVEKDPAKNISALEYELVKQ